MRKAVEQRLTRLERILNDNIVSVQVVIAVERSRTHVELTLHARGDHFLHGAAAGRDLTAALGAVARKLEHQAERLKSKWTEGRRQAVSAAKAGSAALRPERARRSSGTNSATTSGDARVGQTRIVRARGYAVKPMSVEEAALEVAAGRDEFLVFRNIASDAVSVLFRRPDGNLGLIEPEA